jgi:hypothetical protein
MKTYVAEINGEAVVAFRASDEEDARAKINDEGGDLQQCLNDSSGFVRADGSALWDGRSEIGVRPAMEAEDESWRKACDNEIGDAEQGKPIEDDLEDFSAYLISVKAVEVEEQVAAS